MSAVRNGVSGQQTASRAKRVTLSEQLKQRDADRIQLRSRSLPCVGDSSAPSRSERSGVDPVGGQPASTCPGSRGPKSEMFTSD